MDHSGESPFVQPGDLSLVRIHPLVLFSILDHYLRRPAESEQGRVIGTLLGTKTVYSSGSSTSSSSASTSKKADQYSNSYTVVEVTNCYPVPHQEKGGQVALGKDFNKQMLNLHKRVNPNEVLLGWFATTLPDGTLINQTSCLIHDFYTTEMAMPLHIVVDTSLGINARGIGAKSLAVKAFTSKALGVKNRSLAAEFRPVKVELVAGEAERIGVDHMLTAPSSGNSFSSETGEGNEEASSDRKAMTNQHVNPMPTMASLEESIERLLSMLDTVSAHVDDVVQGRVEADYELGRQIADVVSTVPRIKPEVFTSSFNNNLNDLLSVLYLSNLTRTQLAVAEKIGQVL